MRFPGGRLWSGTWITYKITPCVTVRQWYASVCIACTAPGSGMPSCVGSPAALTCPHAYLMNANGWMASGVVLAYD